MKNGFLVESENALAWASKLNELLSDSFDRKAFGRAAHAYVDAKFSWDGIAKRYLETLSR
jgi:glycosyltransferase involved in cell wall biosynthesis